jgi:hypothetical protein
MQFVISNIRTTVSSHILYTIKIVFLFKISRANLVLRKYLLTTNKNPNFKTVKELSNLPNVFSEFSKNN